MYAVRARTGLTEATLTFDTERGADLFIQLWTPHWRQGIEFTKMGCVRVKDTPPTKRRKLKPKPERPDILALLTGRPHAEAQVA